MDNKFSSRIEPREYTYEEVMETIDSLKADYPFLGVQTIGKSTMGKDIPALVIGSAKEYVLYTGAFHGMERLTCMVLLMFAEELCHALMHSGTVSGIRAGQAMFGRGLAIVPLVNPDGYEIALRGAPACGHSAARIYNICKGEFSSWNANARGVDINHNFDAGWAELREMEKKSGINGPAPRQYGGPRAESEPETAALTALCRDTAIRHVLAFHSQGEEIYWNYGDRTPPAAMKMAKVMAASTGYLLEEPSGLASMGGFKDWFIEEFGRPGFTLEIGKGENPLSPAELPGIYEKLREMMMTCVLM